MTRPPVQNSYLERSRHYYDRRFGSGDPALDEDERLRLAEIERLLVECAGPPGQAGRLEILDLGCGRGWLSGRLLAWGTVSGVDLSDAAIAAAKQAWPEAEFVAHDVTDPTLVDRLGAARFDLVVSSEVVEHVLDQDAYFQNIHRLLAPGSGRLILTTPNGRWKRHYFHGDRRGWGQPYEFWMLPQELRAQVGRVFDQVRVSSFHSRWIDLLPSYGIPLAGRRIGRLLGHVGLEQAWYRLLDRRLLGLYLTVLARHPREYPKGA